MRDTIRVAELRFKCAHAQLEDAREALFTEGREVVEVGLWELILALLFLPDWRKQDRPTPASQSLAKQIVVHALAATVQIPKACGKGHTIRIVNWPRPADASWRRLEVHRRQRGRLQAHARSRAPPSPSRAYLEPEAGAARLRLSFAPQRKVAPLAGNFALRAPGSHV